MTKQFANTFQKFSTACRHTNNTKFDLGLSSLTILFYAKSVTNYAKSVTKCAKRGNKNFIKEDKIYGI